MSTGVISTARRFRLSALLGGRPGGQVLIGGSNTTDDLVLRATPGAGVSGSDIIIQVGNNGATEALRVLFDGKVGIGTAAPSKKLHVLDTAGGEVAIIAGGSGTPASSELVIYSDTYTGNSVLKFDSRNNSAVRSNYSKIEGVPTNGVTVTGDLSFSTTNAGSSTEKMRILSDGKIGIGTSAPTETLMVNGNIAPDSDNNHDLGTSSLSFANLYLASNIHYKSDLLFKTSTVEKVRITTGGSVGINTTSPQTLLEVLAGTDAASILWGGTIRNAAATVATEYGAGLKLKISDYNPTIQIKKCAGISAVARKSYSNRTDLAFYVNPSSIGVPGEKMRLSGNGCLGIGLSDPGFRLQVEETDASTANVYDGRFIVISNPSATVGTKAGLGFINNGVSTAGIASNYLGSNGGDLLFWTRTTAGAIAEKMRILSTGNVGIGTTAPGYTLDVNGDINISAAANFRKNGSVVTISPWVGSGSDIYFTGGKVTIGTTSPGANLLYVYANSLSYNTMTIENAHASGSALIVKGGSGTQPTFQVLDNTAANRFMVLANGNVAHALAAGVSSYMSLVQAGSTSGNNINPVDANGGLSIKTDSGRTGAVASFTVQTYNTGYADRLQVHANDTVRIGIDNSGSYDIYAYHNQLNTSYGYNADIDMAINYAGYNNGATRFRNVAIYDGKANMFAYFDGVNQRVSIGKSPPSSILDVWTATSNINVAYFNSQAATSYSFGVGIAAGTNSSDYSLEVLSKAGSTHLKVWGDSRVQIPSAYNNVVTTRAVYVDNNGYLGTTSSSLRYKQNVTDIEDISWLSALRPVNFEFKKYPGKKMYGLIAEEVDLINPALVDYDSEGRPDYVSYDRLIAPMLKLIQSLQARVAALEAKVA